MNREIKFRVWVRRWNKYIYPEVIKISTRLIKVWYYKDNRLFDVQFHMHAVILEQYTGLKDAKGKNIYEGDILQIAGIVPVCVSFDHGSFIENTISPTKSLWQFITDYEKFGPPEVIGNIHENKELLQSKE